MKDEHVMDHLTFEPERPGELARAVHRPSVSGQRDVEGEIAFSYRTWDGVVDELSNSKVLEEVAGSRFSSHPPLI